MYLLLSHWLPVFQNLGQIINLLFVIAAAWQAYRARLHSKVAVVQANIAIEKADKNGKKLAEIDTKVDGRMTQLIGGLERSSPPLEPGAPGRRKDD